MKTQDPSSNPTPEAPGSGTPRAAYITCYVLLGLLLAWVLVQRYFRPLVLDERITVATSQVADGAVPSAADLTGQVDERIDPNTATWAELTRLPRIGESIAKRIVEYRESHSQPPSGTTTRPVFTCPQDLGRIRGIGPKTIEQIGPFLRFATSQPD